MAIEFFAHDASRVYKRFLGDEQFTPITEPVDYDLSSIGSGRVQSVGFSNPWGLTVFVSTMKWVPPPRQLPVTENFLGPAVNVPIVALDPDASMAFYKDLLGIPVRFDGSVQDPDVNRIMGAPPDLRFHITVFFIGDGQMAEHHFHDPRRVVEHGRPPDRLRTGTLGSTYGVTGLDSILARARASGYEPRGPIVSRLPPYGSARVACLTGPNGELVELVERG
jgi:catechol 2,3-dioxygenase-like lactoylglutathione lyase family enzyme